MMRVGVFSDVHGNVVALRAVVGAFADEALDAIVCLGDVAYGPCPAEATAVVRDLGCPVIAGNAEVWLSEPDTLDLEPAFRPRPLHGHRDAHRRALAWARAQLSDDDLAWMRGLPGRHAIALPGDRELLCVHGSPRHYFDFVLATTEPTAIDAMLAGTDAAIVAGGHTHQQLLRRHRERCLINPGSVGRVPARSPWPEWWARADELSADGGGPTYSACAEYAVLDVTEARVSVRLERVAIDHDAVAAMVRHSGMPGGDAYIDDLGAFA